MDSEVVDALRAICEGLGGDHSSIWQVLLDDAGQLLLTHIYRSPDLPPAPERMSASEFFPWALKKLEAKEVVYVPDTAQAPPEAARDMETWRDYGVKSTLGIPLSVGGDR